MWNKMSSLSAKKSCTSRGEKIFLSSPVQAQPAVRTLDPLLTNPGAANNKCEKFLQILKIRQENALRGIFVGELA